MSEPSPKQPSRALRWLCGAPLVALLGIELSIRHYDGWGAWASAPLLLVPALLGLPIVILGLADCLAAARVRAPTRGVLLCMLVAAVPILWLGVRRFFT